MGTSMPAKASKIFTGANAIWVGNLYTRLIGELK